MLLTYTREDQTKDILCVTQLLSHKRTDNTLLYARASQKEKVGGGVAGI